jgi:hypothetical protein
MPDEILPAPVDDNLKVLELRAQWSIPGRAGGESRWRFVMLRTGLFDQQVATWERWRDTLKDYWEANRAGGWTHEQVIVRDLWPALAPDLVVPIGYVVPGDGSDQGPPQSSPIINRLSWPKLSGAYILGAYPVGQHGRWAVRSHHVHHP